MFRAELSRELVKELKKLRRAGRKDAVRRFFRATRELEKDPYRPRSGVDIRPLRGGGSRTYRLRIGAYRAIYEIDPDAKRLLFTLIARRGAAYD